MGLHRSSPAWPARLVAVCAALFLLVLLLAAAAPRAHAQDPEFSALVFSKTTGFRHTDAIDAGQGRAPGARRRRTASRSRSTEDAGAVHRRRPARRSRSSSSSTPTARASSTPPSARPSSAGCQRGGGIVGIHADANADRDWAWKGDMMGGALVPQPPVRRPPVPERHGRQRGPDAPRDGGHRRPTWVRDGRVVQLHRGAARQGPRPRHARREHLRRAGRHAPPPTTTRSRGARTTTAAAHFYTALGHHGTAWQEPRLPDAHPRRDRVGRRRRRGRLRRGARGPPDRRRPSTRSRSTTTPRTRWRSRSRPTATSTIVELAGRVKHYNPRPQARPHRSARSRCTAATRTACSASRSTRTSPPTGGSTSSTARRRPRIQHVSRFTLAARRRPSTWPRRSGCSSSRTSGSSAATPPAR